MSRNSGLDGLPSPPSSSLRNAIHISRKPLLQGSRGDAPEQIASSASTSVLRRRKSRSPDSLNLPRPSLTEAGSSQTTSAASISGTLRYSLKRKKSLTSPTITSIPSGPAADGTLSDKRGMRLYELQQPNASTSALPLHISSSRLYSTAAHPLTIEATIASPAVHRSRKEKLIADRPISHLSHHQSSRRQSSHLTEDIDRPHVEKHAYSGPLAVAEFERMRKEIENLKKSLHDGKKTAKKQSKKIEDLKAELNAGNAVIKDREQELRLAQAKSKQNEELLGTIETSLLCQICMDLPHKPYALAPCGHVLCLACLQEWFRKAPPSANDLDADTEDLNNPRYILTRPKTCPCCRSVVGHRPAPVFMVKDVVSALTKARSLSIALNGADSPPLYDDCDPWCGIFPVSDDDSDEDGESEDYEDAETWAYRGPDPFTPFDYGSESESDYGDIIHDDEDDEDEDEDEDEDDSDEDPSDDHYVESQWRPPLVQINPVDYFLSSDSPEVSLLRRGCTMGMIQNYNIDYTHDAGIVLFLRSLNELYPSDDEDNEYMEPEDTWNRVFLGWNISLANSDHDGDDFVTWILRDIREYPRRWLVTGRPGVPGACDAKQLVRFSELDAEQYITTDTEVWLDAEDDDSV